ncbi:MAG: hypothetical protein Q8N81_06920 [bacterium]|nr:hypothetical protein [bacterium]
MTTQAAKGSAGAGFPLLARLFVTKVLIDDFKNKTLTTRSIFLFGKFTQIVKSNNNRLI